MCKEMKGVKLGIGGWDINQNILRIYETGNVWKISGVGVIWCILE